jgi:stage III sporulation protein AE
MKNRKKWAFVALLLIVTLIPRPAYAQMETADYESEIQNQLGQLNLGELEQAAREIPQEIRELWGGKSARELAAELTAGNEILPQGEQLLARIGSLIGQRIKGWIGFAASMLALAILSGMTGEIKRAFGSGASDMAGFICYAMSVISAVCVFSQAVSQGAQAVSKAGELIELCFPPLLLLLSASGAAASAGVMQPAGVLLTGVCSQTIENLLLPLLLAMGAVSVMGHFSQNISLEKLLKLLKSLAKWCLGILCTIFLGTSALKGIMSKSLDGLSLRTAKFALDRMVPYVGSLVSGSAETILRCASVAKNAFGLVSVLLVFAVLALPLLDIALAQLSMRLSAALVEPIGAAQISKALSDLADVLGFLFAAVAAQGVMFALMVGMIIGIGNTI